MVKMHLPLLFVIRQGFVRGVLLKEISSPHYPQKRELAEAQQELCA
jgi:hypothetical protein